MVKVFEQQSRKKKVAKELKKKIFKIYNITAFL